MNRERLLIIMIVNRECPFAGIASINNTQRRKIMIEVSVKGVLIGILLIALIVLVVFLIVLIANITDTIKKANAIIDGSTNAVGSAKEKVDNVSTMVKEKAGQAKGIAATGVKAAAGIISKIIK